MANTGNVILKVLQWYRENGRSLEEDIMAHLHSGYIIHSRDFFMLARGVRLDADPDEIANPWHYFHNPDAWFIWMLASTYDMPFHKAFTFEPDDVKLGHIGWARHNRQRFYPREQLERRIITPCTISLLFID